MSRAQRSPIRPFQRSMHLGPVSERFPCLGLLQLLLRKTEVLALSSVRCRLQARCILMIWLSLIPTLGDGSRFPICQGETKLQGTEIRSKDKRREFEFTTSNIVENLQPTLILVWKQFMAYPTICGLIPIFLDLRHKPATSLHPSPSKKMSIY